MTNKGLIFRRIIFRINFVSLIKHLKQDVIKQIYPDFQLHMIKNLFDDKHTVNVIATLIHPIKKDNKIDTSKRHCLFFISPTISLYEKIDGECNDGVETEHFNIAKQDSYDFKTGSFTDGKFKRHFFYSNSDCDRFVSDSIELGTFEKLYGNRHRLIDEFIFECNNHFKCNCDCVSDSVALYTNLYCKNCTRHVCHDCWIKDCKVNEHNVEETLNSNVLNLDELKRHHELICKKRFLRNDFFRFSNKFAIDEEYWFCGRARQLPFIDDGNVIISENDDLISLVFDIECVNVYMKNGKINKKIPDKVCTIAACVTKGNEILDITYFTIVKMDYNTSNASILSMLPQNVQEALNQEFHLPLPQVNVINCETLCNKTSKISGDDDECLILSNFIAYVNRWKPHVCVSFNGNKYDFPVLIRSCLKFNKNLIDEWSFIDKTCIKDVSFKPHEKVLRVKHDLSMKGKYFEGLIPSKIYVMEHDTMLNFISVDLWNYNNNSLDVSCKNKLGIQKTDVSYSEIPILLYSRDPRLLIYNCNDTLITLLLYKKDFFLSIVYHLSVEKITSCPWDYSSSGKVSQAACLETYRFYKMNRLLQSAKPKPFLLHTKIILGDILNFFRNGCDVQYLKKNHACDESVHLLTEYVNGNVAMKKQFNNINFMLKAWKVDQTAHVSLKTCMKAQVSKYVNNIRSDGYSTIDFLTLLSFFVTVNNKNIQTNEQWLIPFSPIVKDFERLNKFRSLVEFSQCKHALIDFLWYLCGFRKHLSPYERIDLIWDLYESCFSTEIKGRSIVKEYVHTSALIGTKDKTLVDSRWITFADSFYKMYEEAAKLANHNTKTKNDLNADFLVRDLTNYISYHLNYDNNRQFQNFVNRFPAYDGAYIVEPKPDIIDDKIVFNVDFVSQYPHVMKRSNMGMETWLSIDTILNQKLREFEDFVVVSKRRVDDSIHYTRYIEQNMIEYVDANYLFFVSRERIISSKMYVFSKTIKMRTDLKAIIAAAKLSNEDVAEKEVMCNAYKIKINSEYGVLGLTESYLFLPGVTGGARCSIQSSERNLLQKYGPEKINVVYGDTDSTFYKFEKTYREISEMGLGELKTFFQTKPSDDDFLSSLLLELSEKYSTSKVKWACKVVESIFLRCVLPELNEFNHQFMVLELEKVMCPFFLPSKKKYMGFMPLKNKAVVMGLSQHNKSASRMTKAILEELMNITVREGFLDLVQLYHFIGRKFTLPLVNNTIDLDLISRYTSKDTEKELSGKYMSLFDRMKKNGHNFMFTNVKMHIINTLPEKEDKQWSLMSSIQYNHHNFDRQKHLKLHIVKTSMDTLSELFRILATKYANSTCKTFERLLVGHYNENLKSIDDGDGVPYDNQNLNFSNMQKIYEMINVDSSNAGTDINGKNINMTKYFSKLKPQTFERKEKKIVYVQSKLHNDRVKRKKKVAKRNTNTNNYIHQYFVNNHKVDEKRQSQKCNSDSAQLKSCFSQTNILQDRMNEKSIRCELKRSLLKRKDLVAAPTLSSFFSAKKSKKM